MANRYIRHRTFTLNEGYEIIQNGDEDTPITINGFLCSTTSVCGSTICAMKYRNEEIGKRIAATTLKEFDA